jgi:hypothetical protein
MVIAPLLKRKPCKDFYPGGRPAMGPVLACPHDCFCSGARNLLKVPSIISQAEQETRAMNSH